MWPSSMNHKETGAWLHEILTELYKMGPRRWDAYVQPALWLQQTTPEPKISDKAILFRLLFERDDRTQIGAVVGA